MDLYSMIAGGLVRHIVSAIFVALAARGYYSDKESSEIVAGLTGAVVMGGWSVWQQLRTDAHVYEAIQACENRILSTIRGKMSLVLLPFVLVGGLSVSACTQPPPNLTPAATTAWDQTRLEKALDVVRDTAQDGSAITPPVVSAKDAVTVTKAHKSLVLIIESQGTGWQNQVKTALDQLLANLSQAARALLAPYVALVKTVLLEAFPS